jgi:uncharacterized membrane protein YkoI
MKRILLLLASLAAVALPTVGDAQGRGRYRGENDSLGAGWSPQQDTARDEVRRGRLIPLGQVLEMIGRRVPGRALDAGLEQMGDRPVYRVRWLTQDGRRIDLIVDATSGAILAG